MNTRLLAPFSLFLATGFSQTPDVGSGPVSESVRQQFVRSYFRNGFHLLVSLPPSGDVRRFGSTGLVQDFPPASTTVTGRYALVKATTSDVVQEGVESVFQVYPNMYSYYSGVGANTAGYPTTDTQPCPAVSGRNCTYQLFDKNFALFVYDQATLNGSNFTTKGVFYTRWRALGGIGTLGSAVNAEETITSGASTGVTATVQQFSAGAVYQITSGSLTDRVLAVKQPVYGIYAANNAHLGFLGLPTGEEQLLINDRRRQVFEGGAIEYDPGQAPVLRLPVSSVIVTAAGGAERLNLGDTFTLQAGAFAANGAALEGRTITWSSSNIRVLTVDPSGSVVTVRAVGGGSATITAISEGKSSRALTYFVTAPCCQIGEGAPTAAIQQSFIDAVTRNRLSVKLPSASPVRRLGIGYVQEFAPADATSTARYLVAKPDASSNAFLITGSILARYLELGGPAGLLGYPSMEVTAGGRQMFQGGALAGSAAYLVTNPILNRWSTARFELGPAGVPNAAPENVLSFTATLGVAQSFTGGAFIAHLSGTMVNRAFFVSGLILARYSLGTLGLPLGEETIVNGRRRQDFEGGAIEYTPGDAEAKIEERERRPQISANPQTVAAGSRIRIAAGGFASGATLRIRVGDQPEFTIKTQSGAYAWEVYVPPTAPSGLVNLRAADVNSSSLAVGSYVVQSSAETLARVTKIRGDLQTGLPGARLPLSLRIAVKDENGNPLAGVAVSFEPSPGAAVEEASSVTDEKGEAEAFLRMPAAELPGLARAEAGRQVVTFSARSQAGSLPNYPRFSQAGQTGDTKLGNESTTIAQKGALLVTAASMVRHIQNRGEFASPNGLADPLILNGYLKDLCVFDGQGERVCDGFWSPPQAERNVNLWRLANFTGGNLDVAAVETKHDRIRDLLAQGSPVLLALALSSGETSVGAHFIVAIGVNSNGTILIHDPNPAFGRTFLDEYLNGFTAGGRSYRGRLSAVLYFAPRSASPLGFVVMTSAAVPKVSSPGSTCGFTVGWPDVQFAYCDGLASGYQLDLAGAGQQTFLLSDVGATAGRFQSSPNLPAAFQVIRPNQNWTPALLQLSFTSESIVNAASMAPALSPGALAIAMGSGMFIEGRETMVEVDGIPARIRAAAPFQVSFEIPDMLGPGAHMVRITSPYGSEERAIELRVVSPAIFVETGGRGVISNQDNSQNGPTNPALRGQDIVVYATGLGTLTEPVTALLEANPLATIGVGSVSEHPGVYYVTLRLTGNIAPGLGQRLVLEQGGVVSNSVLVSVQ